MIAASLAQRIERALRDLHHGEVHLVVHEAQVVRIERIERVRLTVSPEAACSPDGRPTDSSEVRRDEET